MIKNYILKCYKLLILLLVLFFNISYLKSKEILHFVITGNDLPVPISFFGRNDDIDLVFGKFWIEYIPVYCNDCSFEDYELLVNNRIKINCTANDLYLKYLELNNNKKASIIFLYKEVGILNDEYFDKFKNEVLLKYKVKKVFLEIDANVDEDIFLSDISMFLFKIKNENIEIGIILNRLFSTEVNEKNYYILKTINRIISNNERIMALDYIYIKLSKKNDGIVFLESFVEKLLDNFDDKSSSNLKEKIGCIFLIDDLDFNFDITPIEIATRKLISFGINNFGVMITNINHKDDYFLNSVYLDRIHTGMYNK